MSKTVRLLILANLLALCVYLVYTVYQKEQILRHGTLLLLELAPVDPRSLMQGDYMTLRYDLLSITTDSNVDTLPRRGFCVVEPDADGVARFKRFQKSTTPVDEGEFLITYTKPDFRILIGAESFFFEEGTGERYQDARFGGLKTDKKGNSLLIGLFDKDRRQILP